MQIVLYCIVFYNNVFHFYVVVGNKRYIILSSYLILHVKTWTCLKQVLGTGMNLCVNVVCVCNDIRCN